MRRVPICNSDWPTVSSLRGSRDSAVSTESWTPKTRSRGGFFQRCLILNASEIPTCTLVRFNWRNRDGYRPSGIKLGSRNDASRRVWRATMRKQGRPEWARKLIVGSFALSALFYRVYQGTRKRRFTRICAREQAKLMRYAGARPFFQTPCKSCYVAVNGV